MRLHSVTPYSRRLQGKNRRTDGGEGISIPERFNHFFSVNSHAYSKKYRNDRVHPLSPIQYPVNLNLYYIESEPRGRISYRSTPLFSATAFVPFSMLSPISDIPPIRSLIYSKFIDDIIPFANSQVNLIEFESHLASLYPGADYVQPDRKFTTQSLDSSHDCSKETTDDSLDATSYSKVSADSDGNQETNGDTDRVNLVGWIHGDLYWEPVGLRPCSKFGSKYHCFNRSCQRCWTNWRDRVVYEITQRLTSTEKNSLRHVTFSPAQDWGLERLKRKGGFEYLRTKAYEVMKEAGVDGAIVVFHPWRVKADVKEIIEETYPDTRVWTYLRSHDLLSQDSDAIELSSHFHLLAMGYLKKSNSFYKDTEWIYNNHGDFDELKRELKYLLSHTGLAYSIDDTERPLFKSYSFIGDLTRGGDV